MGKSMVCKCGRTYKPALEDVGAYLALYWVPTRSDGKCGKALVAICNSPVAPGTILSSKSLFSYSYVHVFWPSLTQGHTH